MREKGTRFRYSAASKTEVQSRKGQAEHMKYAIEKDSDGVRLLLENGDSILIKLTIGNVMPNGAMQDGTPIYNIQHHVATFVTPKETKAKDSEAR